MDSNRNGGRREANLLIVTFCSYTGKANSLYALEKNGGDDETRTRDLCRDRLDGFGFSVTYILAGAAKSLKGTVGTVRCG